MTISDEPGADTLSPATRDTGRERVGRAAYELFSQDGIRSVGVDAIIAHAGTAKMTLYRNFPSKNTSSSTSCSAVSSCGPANGWRRKASAGGRRRASSFLAIFDVFAEWFARPDFEGCAFLTTMIEVGDDADPIRQAAVRHLANIRATCTARGRGRHR